MMSIDEKRAKDRSRTERGMRYKFAGSGQIFAGACINVSGSGIVLRTDRAIEAGKALEVRVPAGRMPAMTAFVEVMRSFEEDENFYIVAAEIKGIKGN